MQQRHECWILETATRTEEHASQLREWQKGMLIAMGLEGEKAQNKERIVITDWKMLQIS